MAKRYIYADPAIERFATPTIHDVHLDAALSNISIAYRNDAYIADQVFPIVTVKKQSDKYFVFDKGSWFRNDAGVRAPGTRAQRVEYAVTPGGPYACTEYAAAKGVPDEIVANADNPLAPDREATEFVTDKLLLALEVDVAGLLFTAANWTNSGSPVGGVWSGSTSTPIYDVMGSGGVRDTVRQIIGRYPNVCVLGAQVWNALQVHPTFLDRIKYTQLGVISEDLVAKLFKVDKLLVGTAIRESGKEGATSSIADVWGKFAWFGYVPPSPGIMTPAAGYTFAWKNRSINRYREDQEHSDVVEATMNWDAKVTSADSGYLLTSAVT